jgi:uncharacterized membrane protein
MGASESSSTSLKPNVAGFICYLGMWVAGIIFLIIEKKNKTVRFHAMQSLVTFGILFILWAIVSNIISLAWAVAPYGSPGAFWAAGMASMAVWAIFFVIILILWIVLMIKTYKDQMYKVPLFGGLAEKFLAKLDGGK